jgi:hypothetical protein
MAVAALRRIQANLKRYRTSVLKAACEGRLVPTEAKLARRERRDYEPADRLLTRILKERRAKWEADQLATMQVVDNPPKDDKWRAKYQEPATPDTSGIPELPDGGDVLLNLVGASVGRSAFATHDVAGANTNQAVGIIRLLQGGLINRVLMYILISPYGQAHIPQIKADVARANFNLDDIRSMPVPLPPLIESCIRNATADIFIPFVVSQSNHERNSLRRAQAERGGM